MEGSNITPTGQSSQSAESSVQHRRWRIPPDEGTATNSIIIDDDEEPGHRSIRRRMGENSLQPDQIGQQQNRGLAVVNDSLLLELDLLMDAYDHERISIELLITTLEALLTNVLLGTMGLTQEQIQARMAHHIHGAINYVSPYKEDRCCVCQDEFENNELLGELDCGHQFHYNCIERWLYQKNVCPVCKRIALSEAGR